jgi:GNAT superfamily N-acetyltransferase
MGERRESGTTGIGLAHSDADIRKCFPVMSELRTQIRETDFVETIRRLERRGFRIAFLEESGDVKAVAGFRIMENLDNGRFLYVDDLVTKSSERSKRYGQGLFDWLLAYGASHECKALTLDSGVQRFDAHRFYLRNKMRISSHHFWMPLTDEARGEGKGERR